jgi:hypothetical protein
MRVLRLSYDQQHTIRSLDEKIAGLTAGFDAARAALDSTAAELEKVRNFRRETLNGMCEAKFGPEPQYTVEIAEDGEHLVYRYGPPPPPSGYDPLQAMAAQQQRLGQQDALGGPLGNLFGYR